MSHWRTNRQAVGGNQLGGSPHRASTPREYFTTERVNPDDYELGGYAIFILVVGGSCSVVLGLVMAYLVFV